MSHRRQACNAEPRPKRRRGVRHRSLALPARMTAASSRDRMNIDRERRTAVRHVSGCGAAAFTLVELLVVMVIIAILISAVVAATSAVFNKAKATNTQAVLTVVQQAVEQFEREQTENPTLSRAQQGTGTGRVRYLDRYGRFPPDELEVFTSLGLPGSGSGARTLGVGQATIVPDPAPDWGAMRFYPSPTGDLNENAIEHRDLAAMIVAIELFSDTASAMLDRLPENNRHPGLLDSTGNPVLFLDRDENERWDPGDLQILYILDGWAMPISYHAQRDFDSASPGATASNNHESWNQASTEMIRVNGGQPLIMSYGANAKDQFDVEWMGNDAAASLVGDWMDTEDERSRINHYLNADNVYADPTLKAKLAEGIAR